MLDLTLDNIKILESILSQRIITPNYCWEFTGYIHHGYGDEYYKGEMWGVHRLIMFIFKRNEFKYILDALHKCNNKKCFNPNHLYMGTQKDNAADSIKDGTFYFRSKEDEGKRTHCLRGHEYNVLNTWNYKGKRYCRECKRVRRALVGPSYG